MNNRLFSMLMILALAIGATTVRGQGLLDAAEDTYVTPKLVADISAIEPGATFRLGVSFKIEDEWHIYWRTPSDSELGLPPTIEWQLPAGFTASEIQWPAPHRLVAAGEVSYVYEGEALLFVTVTAPKELPTGSIEFGATVEWLACQEECIPGGPKDLKLKLEAGARKESPEKALFDKYAALVPKADSKELNFKYDGPKSIEAGTSATTSITISPAEGFKIDEAETSANAASLDLYPIWSANWVKDHSYASKPTLTADGAKFEWTFTAAADAPTTTTPAKIVARVPLVDADGNKRLVIAEFALPLEAAPAAQATAAPAVAATPKAPAAAEADKAPAPGEPPFSFLKGVDKREKSSFWQLLLFAFVGGLILNVMPCVLPVLSLKVMSFVKQAGEEPGRIWRLGIMFAVGVVSSFVLLASVVIGLKIMGNEVGWGFQMQEPRFVIAMAAVIVALGLSLFGVYEIGLPGSAAGSMDRVSRQEGYAGAFFNGVLITALATPCTAPMLGPALGFAFTQPAIVILLFFIAIALGLAAPYVLLAANPKLIKWMPKPGAWMNTFKQFMGFLMMGTAIWLMYILASQIGAEGLVWTMAFLLAVGLACWLIGLAYDYNTRNASRRFYLGIATAAVIGGYVFFPELYLNRLATTAGSAPVQTVATTGDIAWEPFSIARIEELAANKQTIFLDLTANWCATCKVNETGVLSTDRVRELFEKHNVKTVRGDWTKRDKVIGSVLSYFRQGGVPLYIVFPAGRPHDYILLNQLLTVGEVEEAIEKASKQM